MFYDMKSGLLFFSFSFCSLLVFFLVHSYNCNLYINISLIFSAEYTKKFYCAIFTISTTTNNKQCFYFVVSFNLL